MSRSMKERLVRDYRERLADIEDAMLISLRGIDANRNNTIRKGLLRQDIHITVVRNALFGKMIAGTSLGPLEKSDRVASSSDTSRHATVLPENSAKGASSSLPSICLVHSTTLDHVSSVR